MRFGKKPCAVLALFVHLLYLFVSPIGAASHIFPGEKTYPNAYSVDSMISGIEKIPQEKAKTKRLLRLDDTYALEIIRVPSVSDDGALAIIRYLNRTDREDVWVQEAPGQPTINITHSNTDSTRWDSPIWSPDGKRLLLVSTRGGNRALWVWERENRQLRQFTKHLLARTRISRGLNLDWVDNKRVLCLVLPVGDTLEYDGLYYQPEPILKAKAGWAKFLEAKETTASVLDAGLPVDTSASSSTRSEQKVPAGQPFQLMLIDVTTGISTAVADSYHPSQPANRVLVSPDGRFVAIGHSVVPSVEVEEHRKWGGAMMLEVRGLDGKLVKFDNPLPEDVLHYTPRWSPDGKELAFFAYGNSRKKPPRLFRANVVEGRVHEIDLGNVDIRPRASLAWEGIAYLEWTETGDLAFQAGHGKQATLDSRRDWWLLPHNSTSGSAGTAAPRVLTEGMKTVPVFKQLFSKAGPLVGVADGDLWRVDAVRGGATNLTTGFAPRIDKMIWPKGDADNIDKSGYIRVREEKGREGKVVVSVLEDGGIESYYLIDVQSGMVTPLRKSIPSARLETILPQANTVVYKTNGDSGTVLWRTDLQRGRFRQVLTANTFVSNIALAKEIGVEYTGLNGDKLTGVVVLPVGYEHGKRYPLIATIYPGNLEKLGRRPSNIGKRGQLAAAAGYAVLFPTMPPLQTQFTEKAGNIYFELADGVLPAVDKLVELGIADPDRLFVEGHSQGGFATYGMVTLTHRFKAAIASAGFTNLISLWGTLTPEARYGNDGSLLAIGWSGDHPQQRMGGATPREDFGRYLRNSPIFYVDRVQTPLMMVKGDMDPIVIQQDEEFFSALHRQGKRAQLVRYWGEGHILFKNRVNNIDMWQRKFAWYDEFGDISRDARGNMIFENGRVKSRGGKPALKPQDYLEFDFFQPSI